MIVVTVVIIIIDVIVVVVDDEDGINPCRHFLTSFSYILHLYSLFLCHEAQYRENDKPAIETCSTVYTSEYYAIPETQAKALVTIVVWSGGKQGGIKQGNDCVHQYFRNYVFVSNLFSSTRWEKNRWNCMIWKFKRKWRRKNICVCKIRYESFKGRKDVHFTP